MARKLDIDLSKPLLVLAQHPVTTEVDRAAAQMTETLEALAAVGYQTIALYPTRMPEAGE